MDNTVDMLLGSIVFSLLFFAMLDTRLTRRVLLVEQELLLTLPEHLSSPPVFSGVRVSRSLVLYVCFVDRCLSFCTFSFCHCVVCSSSIYGFWLPLLYLQTLLVVLLRSFEVRSPKHGLFSNYSSILKVFYVNYKICGICFWCLRCVICFWY
jgi:hypothetical protein